jgi:hypothetical protein
MHAVVESDTILNLAVSLADKNRWPGFFRKLWHEDICIWEILIYPRGDHKLALVLVFCETLFKNSLPTNNKNLSDVLKTI